jgi:hypothetical protein
MKRALSLIACGVVAISALTASLASAAPKRPPEPAPHVRGSKVSPPPAWIETASASHWLAYSSYCWTRNRAAVCADFIPPPMRVKELARLELRRGETVRFHLGFQPTAVSISFFVKGKLGRQIRLAAKQDPAWKATVGGVLLLEARVGGGDASYAAVVTLR